MPASPGTVVYRILAGPSSRRICQRVMAGKIRSIGSAAESNNRPPGRFVLPVVTLRRVGVQMEPGPPGSFSKSPKSFAHSSEAGTRYGLLSMSTVGGAGRIRVLGERFDAATAFAGEAHRHQVRKGTSTPYISHLLGVASLVLEYGGTEQEAIAGLLHDCVEDCWHRIQGVDSPAIRRRCARDRSWMLRCRRSVRPTEAGVEAAQRRIS